MLMTFNFFFIPFQLYMYWHQKNITYSKQTFGSDFPHINVLLVEMFYTN